jgi:Zn-finger protein
MYRNEIGNIEYVSLPFDKICEFYPSEIDGDECIFIKLDELRLHPKFL